VVKTIKVPRQQTDMMKLREVNRAKAKTKMPKELKLNKATALLGSKI
jgi:hypothetical protein